MGSSLSSREGLELVSMKNNSTQEVKIQFIHPYRSSLDLLLVEAGTEKSVETSVGSISFLDQEDEPQYPYSHGKIIPNFVVGKVIFCTRVTPEGARIDVFDK